MMKEEGDRRNKEVGRGGGNDGGRRRKERRKCRTRDDSIRTEEAKSDEIGLPPRTKDSKHTCHTTNPFSPSILSLSPGGVYYR